MVAGTLQGLAVGADQGNLGDTILTYFKLFLTVIVLHWENLLKKKLYKEFNEGLLSPNQGV